MYTFVDISSPYKSSSQKCSETLKSNREAPSFVATFCLRFDQSYQKSSIAYKYWSIVAFLQHFRLIYYVYHWWPKIAKIEENISPIRNTGDFLSKD